MVASLLLALTASDTTALAQNGSAALPAICRTNHTLPAFIEEASRRFAIPARWICSVLSIETAGDMHARSPKGAMGLMQIMPATWAELRQRYDLGSDPYDPRDNILAGTAYLRELLDRYGSRGAFAAYNAGPTRYEEISREPLCQTRREHTWQSLQICLAFNCRRRVPRAGGHQQPRRCSLNELSGWKSAVGRHRSRSRAAQRLQSRRPMSRRWPPGVLAFL
ncbi:lytic transglycosylase domain-containing protein [Bradyrhizobium pachyrhizi]|uniref:lytic transglycosylase domain-containing protein n=1 Tax=Bradyrhizobium pachyrhizi TaxID=280333 RepID=UPI0032214771